MSRLPQIKHIATEDFPTEKDWIGKLLVPLNNFMSSVYTALNHGITINENMRAFTFTADVLGGKFPFDIPNTLTVKPIGVMIASIFKSDDVAATIGTAQSIEWIMSGEKIRIKNIYGLTSNQRYTVTFLVLGG